MISLQCMVLNLVQCFQKILLLYDTVYDLEQLKLAEDIYDIVYDLGFGARL